MHGGDLSVSREKPFDFFVFGIVIQVADIKFRGSSGGNAPGTEKSAEKIADAV